MPAPVRGLCRTQRRTSLSSLLRAQIAVRRGPEVHRLRCDRAQECPSPARTPPSPADTYPLPAHHERSKGMPIYALGDRIPAIDATAYVHPDAVVIGDVTIGAEASVWPTAVLRGDGAPITVGARTSIQDGTVVHCTDELATTIGDDCVVGHNAHLEGCIVEDGCLVGSGSVLLHRVVVRAGAVVAADRKSTRLNSSHPSISYAVFCLKKKKK